MPGAPSEIDVDPGTERVQLHELVRGGRELVRHGG